MRKTLLLLLVFNVIVFSSCKKNSSSESNTDLLTKGTWILEKDESKSGTGAWETETLDDCEKDDNITFKSDHTVITDQGQMKCDEDEPQSQTGTWAFGNGEKTIIIASQTFTIETLTNNKFVISITVTDLNGGTYSERIHFKR